VKFRRKDYTLRNIWDKICTGLEKITSAIDPFMALDQSGKAALPWAVVKLILGVESNNMSLHPTINSPSLQTVSYPNKQLVAASSGIASITEVITYSAEFEPIYLQGESKVVEILKNTIILASTCIQRF